MGLGENRDEEGKNRWDREKNVTWRGVIGEGECMIWSEKVNERGQK